MKKETLVRLLSESATIDAVLALIAQGNEVDKYEVSFETETLEYWIGSHRHIVKFEEILKML